MNSISKYFFKITLIVLVGLLGSSCNPEYLRPSLPGKIPIVETLPNQNLVAANSQIQLRGSCYLGEENLMEVGFLVSAISGFVENDQSVEKVIVSKSDLTLTGEGEYLFEMEFNVGLVPDLTKYYRAFCKNSLGIGYGEQASFTTYLALPALTTNSVSQITSSGATAGGNVTSDGGSAVTIRGVAYGTLQNPTTANSSTSNGAGTGAFTSTLSGLTSSTFYYVRAYATNAMGTAYGSQVSFTTSLPGVRCNGTPTVTDIDGNIYNTVQIGSQCWTQSNLKVSKYRNGVNIPTGLSDNAWLNANYGAYAIYNNDPVNDGLYGKLYNNYAVTDSLGLCPTGWHVPSDAEWTILENQLGGSSEAGGALKSTATQPTPGGWASANTGATNSSGFTALPGGQKAFNTPFSYVTINGFWWSSSVYITQVGTYAWGRKLYNDGSSINRHNYNRQSGFSVRCLRD